MRAVTKLGIATGAARWAPNRTVRAFTGDSGVCVGRLSGSLYKQLYYRFFTSRLDWPPDGVYVAGREIGTPALIDIVTCRYAPTRIMAGTHGSASPSWKP